MIKNLKQLKTAKKNLAGLKATRDATRDADDQDDYTDLVETVAGDIAEYEALESGNVRAFDIGCMDDLGEALIKARIAKGWTHGILASELGVSEQAVQRAEGREYENSGLAYLAELLDTLDYELVGCVRPRQKRFLPHANHAVTARHISQLSTPWPDESSKPKITEVPPAQAAPA